MKYLCFAFIYLFEQAVAFFYFTNKVKEQPSRTKTICSFIISFGVQFALHLCGIQGLNIISFFICNFIISYFVYRISLSKSILNVLLLEVIMGATEYIIIYSGELLGIGYINEFNDNPTVMILETFASKSLYFFFTYFLLKLSSINNENNTEGFSVILLVLPLNSIAIFFAFAYLTTHINLDDFSIRVFIIVSIITLVTNLIVAFIHEKTVNLLNKNAELQLETQKAEINTEYYKEMENQNSLADSLVHDIKRHLNIIQSLSTQNDIAGINDYIESVQRSSRIKDIKQYSDNKLVNIIVTRYAHKCLNENIDFNSDIRNVNFDFIELSDITTIIGNLLENSYEASRIADDKYVSISIDNINEEFLRIKTVNSVVSEPEIKNGNIVSSKRNKKGHGIGLKSIKKAAQKYDGDINWTYDDQANQFTVIVLLRYSNRI